MEEFHITWLEYLENSKKFDKGVIDGKYYITGEEGVDYNDETGVIFYKDGKAHRIDGPAIQWNNGNKYWKVNGEFHRLDGAAKEYADGEKHWYVNGKLHRLDGPAIEFEDGVVEYYIDDKEYSSKEEYEAAVYLYKNQLESYK